jgi:hypothetical protein
MNTSTSDAEPRQAGATLISPHKPTGPNRRLPTAARQKPTSGGCFRDFVLTALVFVFLAVMVVSVIVCGSIITTQTIAFGYEVNELPKLANDFWRDFKRELLPSAWYPTVGRFGNAYKKHGALYGALDYRTLPIMTAERLKDHDGSNPNLPVLLSITGLIFDVSTGRGHYEVGGSYSFLAAKDATVSFVTGCFEEECFRDQAVGWTAVDQDGRRTIRDWVQSYKDKYILYSRLQHTFDLYHANDPAQEHQKLITPVDLTTEKRVRASNSIPITFNEGQDVITRAKPF